MAAHRINGAWFVASPKLRFTLGENAGAVTGAFTAENDFTAELSGIFDGTTLGFTWKVVHSWLNIADAGVGTLTLSADGTSFSGDTVIKGKPVKLLLTRQEVPQRAAPIPTGQQPAAPPPIPPVLPPQPPAEKKPPYPDWPPQQRNAKLVWDAERDPNLMKQLIKKAEDDPDLKQRLIRRGHLKPKDKKDERR